MNVPFTVGCVPYVNAIPLVSWFEEQGSSSPVRVIYDVPSRLPRLLEGGTAQATLVSSIDALKSSRRMAAGVCIGSDGPVKSVRLFSKVPLKNIQSLALDISSMTSNALAQILLSESYGIRPSTRVMAPSLELMLQEADACVLIGDIGMIANGAGLRVLDLGEAWTSLTGLPFLWAAWIGGDDLSPNLAAKLLHSARQSCMGRQPEMPAWVLDESVSDPQTWVNNRRKAVLQRAMDHGGWSERMANDYLRNVMVYEMGDRMLDGLRTFGELLNKHELLLEPHFPEVVEGLALDAGVKQRS
jgi:chorismate dehydratase